MGLKAVTIYRDNCKRSEPLSIKATALAAKEEPIAVRPGSFFLVRGRAGAFRVHLTWAELRRSPGCRRRRRHHRAPRTASARHTVDREALTAGWDGPTGDRGLRASLGDDFTRDRGHLTGGYEDATDGLESRTCRLERHTCG